MKKVKMISLVAILFSLLLSPGLTFSADLTEKEANLEEVFNVDENELFEKVNKTEELESVEELAEDYQNTKKFIESRKEVVKEKLPEEVKFKEEMNITSKLDDLETFLQSYEEPIVLFTMNSTSWDNAIDEKSIVYTGTTVTIHTTAHIKFKEGDDDYLDYYSLQYVENEWTTNEPYEPGRWNSGGGVEELHEFNFQTGECLDKGYFEDYYKKEYDPVSFDPQDEGDFHFNYYYFDAFHGVGTFAGGTNGSYPTWEIKFADGSGGAIYEEHELDANHGDYMPATETE